MKTKGKTRVSHIPQHVMEEIFHKLPYKAMSMCKLSCKSWSSIISSPNFINDHYNRLRIQGNIHLICSEYKSNINFGRRNFPTINIIGRWNFRTISRSDIVDNNRSSSLIINNANLLEDISKEWSYCRSRVIGSYNGLVAISRDHKLILWNPLTNERSFVKVDFFDYAAYSPLYGLCYDKFKDEYSVVVGLRSPIPVTSMNFKENALYGTTNAYLYDFKDGKVKLLCLNPLTKHLLDKNLFKGEIGKVIRGVPHWVVEFHDWEDPFVKTGILYFDRGEEVFKEMDRPTPCVEKKMLGLAAMNGENELGCVVGDVVSSCFEIWVMKEYGNVESWTNLFKFSYMNLIDDHNFGCIKYFDVMRFMSNNGELLICLYDDNVRYNKLLVYDVYKANFREINLENGKVFYSAITFEPKLISPPRQHQKS